MTGPVNSGDAGCRHARCWACGMDWRLPEGAWGPSMACPGCGRGADPGAFLGRYQLLRRVGEGGAGVAFEALDSVLGREVCIKRLRPEVAAAPGLAEALAREARLLAGLAHPNVVGVYDFFGEVGDHYLVMEWLGGGTLQRRLAEGGPLTEGDLLRVGLDVARGLAAAAAKGVLHRDVKPGNIVFDAAGRARLVDFGLAVPMDEAGGGGAEAWGSPHYVSPERVNGGAEDARSDIYSLGATLHDLTESPPTIRAAAPRPGARRPAPGPTAAPPRAVLHPPTAPADPIGAVAAGHRFELRGTLVIELENAPGPAGRCDLIDVNGHLDITGGTVEFAFTGSPANPHYIFARFGSRSGSFATARHLPPGYAIEYGFGPGRNQIALVRHAPD